MAIYKNEKTGKWFCSFYVKNYDGVNKKKKKEGFALRRDAAQWEQNYRNKMNGTADITFASLTEEYLQNCELRQKPTTIETKKYTIEAILKPAFGEKKISDITTNNIRQWQNELITGKTGRKIKTSTARAYNGTLQTILDFGVNFFGLNKNPAKIVGSVHTKNERSEKRIIRFWQKDQFEAFLKKVDDIRYHLAYSILFWCGIRRGELLGLQYKNIDLKHNKIKIVNNKVQLKNESKIQTTKTITSEREIGIPKILASEIKKYVKMMYKPDGDDYLFDFAPVTLDYDFKMRQIKNKIEPRIRLHDLRHSHASLLINLGFSPQAVADRLGHVNASMVLKIYGHLYPQKRDEITAALNRIS